MAAEVLGKISFLETPDVSGIDVLLNAGGVPQILADTTANLPAAGIAGRLFVDTTTNLLYRDTGSAWVTVGSAAYTGTTDQITVTGTVIALAANPIVPGTGGMRVPTGTTAERPVASVAGDTRFNTTTGRKETYNGTFWAPEGTVLQMASGSIAAITTTTQTPFDNTVPTIAEGSQIWTQSFTPISATSRIVIQFSITTAQSTVARTVSAAVFAGSTCVGTSSVHIPTGATTQNLPVPLPVQIVYSPGSTAAITFSARVGANGTGTTYVNTTTAGTQGGTLVSQYTITEIA